MTRRMVEIALSFMSKEGHVASGRFERQIHLYVIGTMNIPRTDNWHNKLSPWLASNRLVVARHLLFALALADHALLTNKCKWFQLCI
jgi:hypothetical protein